MKSLKLNLTCFAVYNWPTARETKKSYINFGTLNHFVYNNIETGSNFDLIETLFILFLILLINLNLIDKFFRGVQFYYSSGKLETVKVFADLSMSLYKITCDDSSHLSNDIIGPKTNNKTDVYTEDFQKKFFDIYT